MSRLKPTFFCDQRRKSGMYTKFQKDIRSWFCRPIPHFRAAGRAQLMPDSFRSIAATVIIRDLNCSKDTCAGGCTLAQNRINWLDACDLARDGVSSGTKAIAAKNTRFSSCSRGLKLNSTLDTKNSWYHVELTLKVGLSAQRHHPVRKFAIQLHHMPKIPAAEPIKDTHRLPAVRTDIILPLFCIVRIYQAGNPRRIQKIVKIDGRVLVPASLSSNHFPLGFRNRPHALRVNLPIKRIDHPVTPHPVMSRPAARRPDAPSAQQGAAPPAA